MEEIISKGYVRKSVREAAPGKIWCLPNHGVYHPYKPGKIRVVFAIRANYKGRCINGKLLSGPTKPHKSNSWCPAMIQRRTIGFNGRYRSNVLLDKGP